MTGRRRVVVTGLGVKCPAGATVDEAFRSLLAAKGTAALLPGPAGRNRLACRVDAFDPDAYFSPRETRVLDRGTQLGVAAALDAFADADLAGAVNARTVPKLMPSSTAAWLSMRLGLTGPALTISTACASGTNAIGEAFRAIQGGRCDVALTGGTEAPVSDLVLEGFYRARALSRRAGDPAGASRPFDADRDGFVLGEGAAFLVLEELNTAQARGARIYCELAGYATNSDAHHIVAPLEDGSRASTCMRAALDDAGVAPDEVAHVNAHGTATLLNDRSEAAAIRRCFDGAGPPVTAPKGVVGHMIGAAGAFEAVVMATSVRTGRVPPVANHRAQPDGDAEINVIRDRPADVGSGPAISNSFGFGGHNASLVMVPA